MSTYVDKCRHDSSKNVDLICRHMLTCDCMANMHLCLQDFNNLLLFTFISNWIYWPYHTYVCGYNASARGDHPHEIHLKSLENTSWRSLAWAASLRSFAHDRTCSSAVEWPKVSTTTGWHTHSTSAVQEVFICLGKKQVLSISANRRHRCR